VALALLGMAHDEHRTFAIVAFTDQVIYEAVVKPGERLDEEALNLSCSGGTDIDAAVARGLDIIERNPGALHQADLVLVTDGCSLAERAAELKVKAKTHGVTVLGVGIGVAQELLEPWADAIETITSLDGLGNQVAEALFAGTA
jgi:uncharacterized protein with von Willebrand factor type A (vWA) domain